MESERERLVNQLDKIKTQCNDEGSFYPACMGCVADFILADRRRVIEEIEKPLLRHKNFDYCSNTDLLEATLKDLHEALAKCEERLERTSNNHAIQC